MRQLIKVSDFTIFKIVLMSFVWQSVSEDEAQASKGEAERSNLPFIGGCNGDGLLAGASLRVSEF
jgi:hypothetical protein